MSKLEFGICIFLLAATIVNVATFMALKELYSEFLRQLWSWQSYIYGWVRRELADASSNKKR